MRVKTVVRLLAAVPPLFLAACQAVLVHEARSSYSHIQVVDHGSRRALVFLGEKPHDAIETIIDLREPHRLQHPYARTMTAGLIYRPDRNIRAAFPAVEIFRPLGSGNVIVLGAGSRPADGELRERARALDRRGGHGFSFERLLDERSK